MDITVTMQRPGYRIKRRSLGKAKIPVRGLITKEESMDFIKEKFNVEIVEEE